MRWGFRPDGACYRELLHSSLARRSCTTHCRAKRSGSPKQTKPSTSRWYIEDCDAVIVHDPQPLPLISHFEQRDAPWIWQYHVDLSSPNPAVWSYLRGFVEQYNLAIFSMPKYAQQLGICGGQEETNGTDHYPANTKLLHWLVAVCVLTTAPVAIAMTRMRGTDPGHSLQFHKSLGVPILILMILRLINRIAVGALTAAPEIEPWQKTISSVVHTRSMCCLIAMPIVGYVANSIYGAPTPFFGLFDLQPPFHSRRQRAETDAAARHGRVLTRRALRSC